MSEWDITKTRLIDLIKSMDDTPTENQMRLYDLTVGALIGEGNKLQAENKKYNEHYIITIDSSPVKEAIEALSERVSEIETELEAKLDAIREIAKTSHIKMYDSVKITKILEVLDG